jgi:hypothetical protein
MPSLAPFEPVVGRRYLIMGKAWTITTVDENSAALILHCADPAEPATTMSRAALAALICLEDANGWHEQSGANPPTLTLDAVILVFLRLSRLYDWFCRLFVLRRLLRVRGHSWKSTEFIAAYKCAVEDLEALRSATPFNAGRDWELVTMYLTLRRWVLSGYAFEALQQQGVAPNPQTEDDFYSDMRRRLKAIRKKHPAMSIAGIQRELKKQLKREQAST